jgi:hypothetical protein
MRTRFYSHYDDRDLMSTLKVLVADERASTVELVACIAEVDKRGLFRPAGYDSMYAYCVRDLHLSGDAAYKRIAAARAALDYASILDALADGRLHLTAVVLLAPHLRPENAVELLRVAEHKTCGEIKLLLAERFPQPELPTRVQALSPPAAQSELVSKPVGVTTAGHELVSKPVEGQGPRPKVDPLAPGRFALQATIPQRAHDKLRYAQALLGHAVPTGDLAEVLERAIDALITQVEKQKLGVGSRQRPGRASSDPRYIPPDVRRKVWERDGARCAFIGEGGHRCGAEKRLEFHHDDPVAIGGEATVDKIQLRCRAHNQFEAECDFGASFMASKREAARAVVAEKRARAETERAAAAAQAEAEKDPDRSVVPWLRHMGCRLEEAREAAAYCESLPPETSLEDRIRAALRFLTARRGIVAKPKRTAA